MATFLSRFIPRRRSLSTGGIEKPAPRPPLPRRQSLTVPHSKKSASKTTTSRQSTGKQKVSSRDAAADDDDDVDLTALLEEENSSHQVVMWTKSFCPYCEVAKDLLLREIKGLDVKVHDLSKAPQGQLVREELQRMTGGHRTVPSIFVHGKHIGGNQELQELYQADKLEKLLFPTIDDDDQKYRAIWKGVILAETERPIVVGLGNYYFPPESIRRSYFSETERKTLCGSKGEASYYTLTVRGKKYTNAAWVYKEPYEEAKHIQNYLSFYEGVGIMKGRVQVQSRQLVPANWGGEKDLF